MKDLKPEWEDVKRVCKTKIISYGDLIKYMAWVQKELRDCKENNKK